MRFHVDEWIAPLDLRDLQWHPDPDSRRYRSEATASRACRWLNSHEHLRDLWLYRPGEPDDDGHVQLERRWLG